MIFQIVDLLFGKCDRFNEIKSYIWHFSKGFADIAKDKLPQSHIAKTAQTPHSFSSIY